MMADAMLDACADGHMSSGDEFDDLSAVCLERSHVDNGLVRLAEEAQRERTARLSARRQRQLAQSGDHASAGREADLADLLSSADLTPDVELQLAGRAAVLGASDDARTRYERVMRAAGFSPMGAIAAFRLAELGGDEHRGDEALILLEWAVQAADEHLLPYALIKLGDALVIAGKNERAETAYAAAVATDHPDIAPRAALVLALRREGRGDVASATELYDMVIGSDHPEYAPDAHARRNALVHRRTTAVVERWILPAIHGCESEDGPRGGDLELGSEMWMAPLSRTDPQGWTRTEAASSDGWVEGDELVVAFGARGAPDGVGHEVAADALLFVVWSSEGSPPCDPPVVYLEVKEDAAMSTNERPHDPAANHCSYCADEWRAQRDGLAAILPDLALGDSALLIGAVSHAIGVTRCEEARLFGSMFHSTVGEQPPLDGRHPAVQEWRRWQATLVNGWHCAFVGMP
jgi:tetratricopeptide (TPR) repeat protein